MVKNMFSGDGHGTNRETASAPVKTLLTDTEVEIRLNRASQFVADGNLSSAVDELLVVIEHNSDNVESQAMLGSLLLAVEQFDAAENLLVSACELSKWSKPEVIANLAIVFREKGEYSMGVKVLTKGLDTAGVLDSNGIISIGIADLQMLAQNYSSAAEWYLLACFKQPHNINLWIEASTLNFPIKYRDLKFAENVLLQGLDFNPGHGELLYNLGLTLHLKDRLDDAIVLYYEALKFNDQSALTLSALATALHSVGNFDAALSLYKKSLLIDSSNVVVLSNFALLLNAVGNASEGVEYSKKALSIDPTSSDALRAHAECLATLSATTVSSTPEL